VRAEEGPLARLTAAGFITHAHHCVGHACIAKRAVQRHAQEQSGGCWEFLNCISHIRLPCVRAPRIAVLPSPISQHWPALTNSVGSFSSCVPYCSARHGVPSTSWAWERGQCGHGEDSSHGGGGCRVCHECHQRTEHAHVHNCA
jgi:hypothetical protein